MSDRKNRDRGRKNANRRGKWECTCWLCISDKEKNHRILEKSNRRLNNSINLTENDNAII
jgi:hypothetical protein